MSEDLTAAGAAKSSPHHPRRQPPFPEKWSVATFLSFWGQIWDGDRCTGIYVNSNDAEGGSFGIRWAGLVSFWQRPQWSRAFVVRAGQIRIETGPGRALPSSAHQAYTAKERVPSCNRTGRASGQTVGNALSLHSESLSQTFPLRAILMNNSISSAAMISVIPGMPVSLWFSVSFGAPETAIRFEMTAGVCHEAGSPGLLKALCLRRVPDPSWL